MLWKGFDRAVELVSYGFCTHPANVPDRYSKSCHNGICLFSLRFVGCGWIDEGGHDSLDVETSFLNSTNSG